MTEIDLDNDQGNVCNSFFVSVSSWMSSNLVIMQCLHGSLFRFQQWPMARLCISNKQVNRLVRTFLWRRVAERALRGTCFGDIPEEVSPAYIADLHRISEAFAAPLANLFAFAKQGHQPCSFIPQKQLALHANPLFWQYGLLAFVSGCCSYNNQHRRQNASAAKAALSKQEESGEKDVDALTFMQAVIMSFVRGMEHGDQTLPINVDGGLLFGYAPDACAHPAWIVLPDSQQTQTSSYPGPKDATGPSRLKACLSR